MSHLGSFSPEALEAFQNAVAEGDVNFAEGETYDFTRCVRADGSHYGTGGKCRIGTETGEKELSPSEKLKQGSASNPAVMRREKDKAKREADTKRMYERSADRREADEALGKVKIVSAETAKKMSDAELKSQMDNANKAAFSKGSNLSPEVMKGLKEQHDIAKAELARRGGGEKAPRGERIEQAKKKLEQQHLKAITAKDNEKANRIMSRLKKLYAAKAQQDKADRGQSDSGTPGQMRRAAAATRARD